MSENEAIEPVTGWRRRLPALAWLYGFALFDLLCFLFFPYHALANYALARYGGRLPAEITLADVQPRGLSTLKVEGLEVHPKGNLSTTILLVDDITLGWGWISLFKRQPDVTVDAHLMGGHLVGTATLRPNDKSDVDLTMENVDLTRVPGLDVLRLDLKNKGIVLGEIKGTVSASVKGLVPPRNPFALEGDLQVTGKDIQIDHGFGLFTGNNRLALNEVRIKARGENGQIEFTDSMAASPDGDAEFKGQLRLMEVLPASLADLQLKFKLQARIAQNLGPVLDAKAQSGRVLRKNTDGSYSLMIRGPLKSSLKSL